jgi:hypothetical protein
LGPLGGQRALARRGPDPVEAAMRRALGLRLAVTTALSAALVCAALAPGASALSIAIDLDPSTDAVEDAATIPLGATLTLAIRIAGVPAATPLNAFELDVAFDPAIATPLGAQEGGFLVPPVETVEVLLAPEIGIAFATFGASAATGAGILATVDVRGDAFGSTPLTLNDVILSAPFGEEIAFDSLFNATLFVVPEPATSLLVLAGCVGLAARRAVVSSRDGRSHATRA